MGVAARQGLLIAFILFMVGFTLWTRGSSRWINVFWRDPLVGHPGRHGAWRHLRGDRRANLDLSVGSMLSFSAIVVLDLHENPRLRSGARHPRDVRADPVCLGAINGFLIGYLRLNSLIVTPRHALGDPRPDADMVGAGRTWTSPTRTPHGSVVFGRGHRARHPDPGAHLRGARGGSGHLAGQDALRAQGLRGRRQRHGRDLFGHSARAGRLQ